MSNSNRWRVVLFALMFGGVTQCWVNSSQHLGNDSTVGNWMFPAIPISMMVTIIMIYVLSAWCKIDPFGKFLRAGKR
jgi:apolipoprotein N-acyltransferase